MRFGTAYVNGHYLPRDEASVSVEDRGNLFADGAYEVIAYTHGAFVDYGPHITRLERSLAALHIPMPMGERALHAVIRQLLRLNNAVHSDAMLYLQVSRGAPGARNHLFIKDEGVPTLLMTVSALKKNSAAEKENGVSAITHPDIRWHRRDIKSIALLPNVIARQKAASMGAREAWFIDETRNVITEASTSNAYIVDAAGAVITHPADTHILNGITRNSVIRLAKKAGVKVVEKPFTLKQALEAKEAFITSTTAGVLPVVKIDGKKIGNGAPGKITQRLSSLYESYTGN